jgi:anti-sigma regulatory factor (Ser/Thr protein kinase)
VCWLATRTFRGPVAPARARTFCATHLSDGLSESVYAARAVEDASLVTSELVTNAVVAGSIIVTVSVELHRTHLYLAVHDYAPGDPARGNPPVDEPSGRGLKIVDAVSRSWGTQHLPNGKRVWAIIAMPEAATAGMDCVVSSLV